jgi:hypothetical protein
MKTNQKIRSVFYALCFTIALVFSFKTSNAQYVRLERSVSASYYGPSFVPGYVMQDYLIHDYYVRFYSNATCTIPATTIGSINAEYSYTMYYDEGLNYGGIGSISNSAGSGVTEIYLGSAYEKDLYIDSYNTAWGLQAALGSLDMTGGGTAALIRVPNNF